LQGKSFQVIENTNLSIKLSNCAQPFPVPQAPRPGGLIAAANQLAV
jgi:hypothetical protein